MNLSPKSGYQVLDLYLISYFDLSILILPEASAAFLSTLMLAKKSIGCVSFLIVKSAVIK